MSYTIEHTMRGRDKPSKQHYEDRADAMKAWDKLTDMALGGDQCLLRDNTLNRILSEYNPVTRSW
jgi:hypothetical protein